MLETDNTVVETAEVIGQAVDRYAQGADFADAQHRAACGSTGIQNPRHDLRNQVADTNTAIAAVRADVDGSRNETRREFAVIETRLDQFGERLLRIERSAGVVA